MKDEAESRSIIRDESRDHSTKERLLMGALVENRMGESPDIEVSMYSGLVRVWSNPAM